MLDFSATWRQRPVTPKQAKRKQPNRGNSYTRHKEMPARASPAKKKATPPAARPEGWTLEDDLYDETITCFCPPVWPQRFDNEEV